MISSRRKLFGIASAAIAAAFVDGGLSLFSSKRLSSAVRLTRGVTYIDSMNEEEKELTRNLSSIYAEVDESFLRSGRIVHSFVVNVSGRFEVIRHFRTHADLHHWLASTKHIDQALMSRLQNGPFKPFSKIDTHYPLSPIS